MEKKNSSEEVEKLTKAAFNGDLEEVKLLIQSGTDINAMGENWNPLHAAIENMNEEVVKYLIECGADVNFLCRGYTPLHHAIDIESDAEIQAQTMQYPLPIFTSILLNAKANINIVDVKGRTPLDFAILWQHKFAIELLKNSRLIN